MNSREKFLTGLFRSLESSGLAYCVLRNYENIFADASSDVDLILERRDLGRFTEILHQAATASGHRFVHSARYGNYSCVFWSPQSEFIRIDFETESRWRIFPILSAREILGRKQRRECYYVPHPLHESAILFLQAVWRGSLSERYCWQLKRLYEDSGESQDLRETYRRAFGSFGDNLAEFHSKISTAGFDSGFCSRLRRSIMRKAFGTPTNWRALSQYVYDDTHRLWERLRKPAGISLLFASAAASGRHFDDLMRKIEFLFPVQKCFIQTIDLSRLTEVPKRWELRLKLQRLRALFKGGLFVRHYLLARDTDLRKIIKTHTRLLYPSRSFFCMEDSKQGACLAHVETGFMADRFENGNAKGNEFSAFLIDFVSTMLEKQQHVIRKPRKLRGMFVVLIGLDGSGKTTLARNLCRMASVGTRFDGVSYFHWRPKLFSRNEFPLPEFEETARKKPQPKTWLASFLSCLRLIKNVILANVAGRWRIRRLVAGNRLMLLDRYFYNYLLDPDSVKFAGPNWPLKLLLPLFPKPDMVLTLKADSETLLARKRELSAEQITRQISIQNNLNFHGTPCAVVDAGEPALRVAEIALTAILEDSSTEKAPPSCACHHTGP